MLINEGNGRWQIKPLPKEAQFAPVRAIKVFDLDRDGHMDILLAGNDYAASVRSGRYDAGKGLVLMGNAQGSFTALSPSVSGWVTEGDARSIFVTLNGGAPLFLAGQNDGPMLGFRLKN